MNQQGRHSHKKLERAPRRPRTRSEAELFRRHEFLLGAAACVGWEWDVETGQVSLEGDAAGLFGVADGAVESVHGFLDLIHPEDRLMAQASLKHALVKGRGPYASAFRVVRPDDGRVLFVEDRGFVSWEDDYSTLRVTGYLFTLSR